MRKESGFCSIAYGVDRFDQFSVPEQFEIFNVNVQIINGKYSASKLAKLPIETRK